jgi:hypothetical protein
MTMLHCTLVMVRFSWQLGVGISGTTLFARVVVLFFSFHAMSTEK